MVAGLSGSYSSSSTDTKSTTNNSGESQSNLQGQSITKRFDDAAKALLDAFTNNLFNTQAEGESQYSRENAIADAQGSIDAIFRQYREGNLPQIYQAQNNTGAYNSTSAQFLANDAYGEAVAKSAGVVQDTIAQYASLGSNEQQLQISALLDAFKLQGSAFEQTDKEEEASSSYSGTSTTNTSSSTSGFSLGGSIGF